MSDRRAYISDKSRNVLRNCEPWTYTEFAPGTGLPQVAGWEINTVNALAALRWIEAGVVMRRAALMAYQLAGFTPAPESFGVAPHHLARLFEATPEDTLDPAPWARRKHKPHCGALSGLWPIGVYDGAALDDEAEYEAALVRYAATAPDEPQPVRYRAQEAWTLFHAMMIETVLVMRGLGRLIRQGQARLADPAWAAHFGPHDPHAEWPPNEGWPGNVVQDMVVERSRRSWPEIEAAKIDLPGQGAHPGPCANWMLSHGTLIDTMGAYIAQHYQQYWPLWVEFRQLCAQRDQQQQQQQQEQEQEQQQQWQEAERHEAE